MKSTYDKIREASISAEHFPNSILEYNFDAQEIEKISDCDHDVFFGVKAVFNPRVPKGTCHVIFKY